MKDFFKPLDFIYDDDLKFTANTAANLANEKLSRLIESSPVVFASKPDGKSELWSNNERTGHDTHSARLMFIEEIKQEPCKHEPIIVMTQDSEGFSVSAVLHKCARCGVELVAEWREASR